MKIGIIDADLLDKGTRHPNLALMKISGYHKQQGHSVQLVKCYSQTDDFDQIFASKVFTESKFPKKLLDDPRVKRGGTGFYPERGGRPLKKAIEHCMPDYELYLDYVNEKIEQGKKRSHYADYLDYSIGFTTRGCFRKCPFCVNKKYKKVHLHSPVEEFYDDARPYIYLWDDNFLGFGKWENLLDEIESFEKPVQFKQGLDIRLMTERKALRLSALSYRGDYTFAFDDLGDSEAIAEKLQLWSRHSSKIPRLYVLCAYNSQDISDIESLLIRIKIIRENRAIPYVMRYKNYKGSEFERLYTNLARWCNQPQFFKKMSFREFCERCQDFHKNPSTECSALASLKEFEQKHPALADAHFDLKSNYS